MRNRSNAAAITSNTKKRISQQLDGDISLNVNQRIEKFGNLIETEMKKGNKNFRRTSSTIPENANSIDIPPPNYLDIRKEYTSKYDKVT